MTDGYVTVRLAADGLGRSARTIRTWIHHGHIGHIRAADGTILVYAPDLPLVHATRQRRRRVAQQAVA